MEKGFLHYGQARVHYLKFGQGPELLIAFHGFADRASIFLPLEQALGDTYTIYSIDLPYNGFTKWDREYFTRHDILGIVGMILLREGKQRYSLMGYSFGGRIALAILPDAIASMDRLILIAPDGIATKGLFNVSVMPRVLKQVVSWLFRWLLQKPRWFLYIIDFLYRLRLLSRFIHSFAYHHISTEKRRRCIFCTWVSLNDFVFNPQRIKDLIGQAGLSVDVYAGRKDEVVPLRACRWLSMGVPGIRLHVMETSHFMVNRRLATAMLAARQPS